MAQKLSVQIELAGAAEIDSQLKSLGETGKAAFQELSAAAEKVGGFDKLDPTEVTQKLQDMGITGVDAINQIQDAVEQAGNLEGVVQGVKNLEQGFGALGKVIRPLGGELRKIQQAAGALYGVIGPIGVAGVAGFAAITAAVTTAAKVTIGFAESINKINNEAIKLGAPVEKVDQFRAALERAGVSAESIGQILQSKLASEKGVGGLQAFINQLQQMPDSIGRSKLAVQEFGAAGAELIRIFQAGGKVGAFSTQGLISAEDAQKATQLEAALNRLKAAYERLNSLSIAPQLTAGLDVATKGVEALGQRLEQAPWATFITGAQLAANPIQGLVNTIIQLGAALLQVKPEQLGQAVQIAGVQFTQFGTVAQQAGQQAQQAGQLATVGFTSYGTVVGEATTKTQTFQQSIAGIVWDYIKNDGVQAWAIVSGAIGTAATAVSDFTTRLATIAWDNISSIGVAAWNALTGAIQSAIDAALRFVGIKPSAPATGGSAPGKASGGLLGGRGTGTSDSNLAWVSRGEYIVPASAVRQPGVLAFLEMLRRSGRIPGFADGGAVGGGSGGGAAFSALDKIMQVGVANQQAIMAVDQKVSIVDGKVYEIDRSFVQFGQLIAASNDECAKHSERLGKKIDDLDSGMDIWWDALLRSSGLSPNAPTGLIDIKDRTPPWPFALGGLMGGRGTGTSDSNLAWLSRGEHIMPARAVAQPGVLALLEALRRSGGNLRSVLDGMGRFALGGMVPRAIPAFASGGLAGGSSNVTIQFPGLPDITGLRASSGVVDELRKAAALAQVRSGGRKPSRYS